MKATAPQDDANNGPAKCVNQKIFLGNKSANAITDRPTANMAQRADPKRRVEWSALVEPASSDRAALPSTSWLTLKPTSDRNVDAEDKPAASTPQMRSAPSAVGNRFIATQIMVLSGGVISGLIRFTAVAAKFVTRYSNNMAISAPQADRMTTCSLRAMR